VGVDVSPLPIYALSGTETSLRLMLLREVYSDPREETQSTINLAQGLPSKPRLPNWRVVTYQFVPPEEEDVPETSRDHDRRTGFSRREIAWEDLIAGRTSEEVVLEMPGKGSVEGSDPENQIAGESDGVGAASVEGELSSTEESDIREGREDRIDLPQVITCQFRYYDGSLWRTRWDSGLGRRLPQAIELLIQIKPTGAAQRERLNKEKSIGVVRESGEDEENRVLQEPHLEKDREWPLFRQVYRLANGFQETNEKWSQGISSSSHEPADPTTEASP